MKKHKKLTSVLLFMALCSSMAQPAFAEASPADTNYIEQGYEAVSKEETSDASSEETGNGLDPSIKVEVVAVSETSADKDTGDEQPADTISDREAIMDSSEGGAVDEEANEEQPMQAAMLTETALDTGDAPSAQADALDEGSENADDAAEDSGTVDEEQGETNAESSDYIKVDEVEQSEDVHTELGNPDKDVSTTDIVPEEYEIFVNADGVYQLTYTIDADTDAENLTIDLTKALEALHSYSELTDAPWLQPGDTRLFEIYIQNGSKHTYKYTEGSFIMQTPNLEENDMKNPPNAPENDGVTVFDGDTLPSDSAYYAGDSFSLGIYSEPIKKLLMDLGMMTSIDAEYYHLNYISYDQYLTLNKNLSENYNTTNISDGIQAYLMQYYSQKDNTEYTDFEEMMVHSVAARDDLFTDTHGNTKLKGYQTVANTNVTIALKGYKENYLPTVKELLKQITQVDYSEYTSGDELKAALKADFPDSGLAELIITIENPSAPVTSSTFLQLYERANGEGSAYRDYALKLDYNPDDVYAMEGHDITLDPEAFKIVIESPEVKVPLNASAFYDNFYQNLLTFIYGDKDTILNATGGVKKKQTDDGETEVIHTIYKGDFTITDLDTGDVFEGCLPAKDQGVFCLWVVRDLFEYPADTLIYTDPETEEFFYFDQEGRRFSFLGDGPTADEAATAAISLKFLANGYATSYKEYVNDSWSLNDIGYVLAEYMKRQENSGSAWDLTDQFFQQLFAGGFSTDDLRSFMMAFNIDGELTSNYYQDSVWSWYHSIGLGRIDGSFNRTKVDEQGQTPLRIPTPLPKILRKTFRTTRRL